MTSATGPGIEAAAGEGWQRQGVALLAALTGAATVQLVWRAAHVPWAWTSAKWLGALGLAATGTAALILAAALLWLRPAMAAATTVRRLDRALRGSRPVLWGAGIALTLAYPAAVLGPLGDFLSGLFIRLAVFWGLVLVASYVAAALRNAAWRLEHAIAAAITLAGVYEAALLLTGISTYPLSLGWSEASRYYYGSLFFSERLYGTQLALPVLHPSRYLLQSVPFLMPGSPLVVHRAWQVLLWLVVPVSAAWLLARRLSPKERGLRWWIAGWAALFLFQGPVYYHLLVGVLPVLWGFNARRVTRTLLLVAVGSAWCGISRINWYPMPGLLAGVLYLLDDDAVARAGRGLRPYLAPALWIAGGLVVAVCTSAVYMRLVDGDPTRFTTSFTSDLLWYRLLPNATYRPGVLLGIALVILPLALVVARRLRSGAWRPSRASLAGVLGILGVLLAGGLIVSVKIGGGGDLHNMDAFLLMLLVVGSHLLVRQAGTGERPGTRLAGLPGRLLWLTAAIPAAFVVAAGGGPGRPDARAAAEALAEVRQAVQDVVGQGGEVLFITQRHTIPFGYVGHVPLDDDYEKVLVMEMAMGDNHAYLDPFYRDLEEKRFALIVSEPLSVQLQGSARAFGEENDVWVERVARPMLDLYAPIEKVNGADIWLLAPK